MVMWLVVAPLRAQPATVQAEIFPESCRVGDTVTYRVLAGIDDDYDLIEDTPPAFPGFDVQGEPERRETRGQRTTSYEWLYRLRAVLPGERTIAPFTLVYTGVNIPTQTERSNPVTVTVAAGGGQRDIRPDRGLVEVPDATRPYRLLLFTLLGLAGMVLGVWLVNLMVARIRARLAARPAPAPPPPPPLHEEALALLAALAAERLPEQGRIDEYHIRMSDIVRGYLSKRYRIKAAESTTSEIADGLYGRGLQSEVIARCREVLYGCDLEKFAGMTPTLDDMTTLMSRARRLIDETALRSYPREGG